MRKPFDRDEEGGDHENRDAAGEDHPYDSHCADQSALLPGAECAPCGASEMNANEVIRMGRRRSRAR